MAFCKMTYQYKSLEIKQMKENRRTKDVRTWRREPTLKANARRHVAHPTVMGKVKKQRSGQTREPPTIRFDTS